MASSKAEFNVGDRVRHPKLGEGDILDIYPMREDTCAVISFEKLGQKKVILKYAKLKLVPKHEGKEEAEAGEK
jgi:DNA helicase-2/ATP-dependent DNA helicase PcrA